MLQNVVSPLLALLALMFCLAGPAAAQSVTTFTPPSENLTRLQDRVDQLERLLAEATDKQERAEMQARRLAAENATLKQALDAARANAPASPIPSEMATGDGDLSQGPAPVSPFEASTGNVDGDFASAQLLLQQQRWRDAEGALSTFLQAHPNSDKAPEARYWLGRTQLVQSSYSSAAETFYTLVRTNPNAPRAADAWVRLGIALRGMGQRSEACAAFRDLPTRYPAAGAQLRQLARQEAATTQCPA
jgi:tol-pal system protein YbgF